MSGAAAEAAALLAEFDRRLRALERAPRLKNASVHDAVIPVYDADFTVRQTVGRQPDGTYTVVDSNGPPPPVPSQPVLEARPGTLVVTWDGLFADDAVAPADWDHVEVHVSTVSGYIPTDADQVATFTTLKGGSVTLALDPVPQYIVFQAVSTSRTESAPTGEVAGTPLPASTGEGGVQTFMEDEPPVGLDAGDDGALWYDTNDGNHPYRWDGGTLAWISIQDAAITAAQTAAATAAAAAATALTAAQTAQTTADGKAVAYFQTAMPTGQVPGDVGDLWFDTDDGNKMYRYSGSAWVVAQDQSIATALTNAAAAAAAAGTAQSTADSKIVTLYQTAPPSGTGRTTGDLWVDTDDFNHLYRWSGSAWVSVRDATIAAASASAAAAMSAAAAASTAAAAAQATADGSIRTYYQATAPTGLNGTTDVGDLWFDTDDGQAYRWSGSVWIVIEDNSIAAALAAAQNAQTTADGKITSYYQIGIPVVGELGDLWYDTNDQNKPYYCSSIAPLTWTSIRDGKIADAQSTADAALDAATTDGLAPAASPAPVMLSGIESMVARWTPIVNADPVTYDVHVSSTLGFTPGPSTLVGSTSGSQFVIRALAGPEPDPDTADPRTLQYDVAYYIRIVARDADGSAAPSLQGVGSVFQVTGINLAADSVTAINIVTGSLTGELFAASVIVGGTFKSGEAGQRVEWGAAGIQGYKSDGSLILNIPTDGSNALFDGEFIIRGATILGGISVQSAQNESTADSVWTLMRGITSPSATPQIATTWDTIHPSTATLTAAQKTGPDLGMFDLDPSAVSHIEWKPSGSYWIFHQIRSGVGTRAWFFNPDGTPKDLFGTGVYFNDAKDWEVWSTVEIPAPAAKAGVYTMFRFIPNPGTDWYINGPLGFNKYTRTNTAGTPAVGTNGTDLFVAEIVSGDNLRITYHTPLSDAGGIPNLPAASTTYQSTEGYAASLCAALFNATGTGGFDVTGTVHNRYATAQRAVGYSLRLIQQSGTGAGSLIPGGSGGWAAANREIEAWQPPISNVRGMGWDGANFWTYGGDGLLYKHTGERWDPAAVSSTYWAQVTFKDTDAGGTGLHETKPGAWKSFSHKRRAKIRYTPPSIPDNGGADDPNAVQLYMARKATQPTNAEMWAQGSPATAVFDLTTLATTGSNPPTTNTFPAANAAKFRNDDDTMFLDGTGKALLKQLQIGSTGGTINQFKWGVASGTTGSSGTAGIVTLTHGLGVTPQAILLGNQGFYVRITNQSATTFTCEVRSPNGGALISSTSVSVFYLAIA